MNSLSVVFLNHNEIKCLTEIFANKIINLIKKASLLDKVFFIKLC